MLVIKWIILELIKLLKWAIISLKVLIIYRSAFKISPAVVIYLSIFSLLLWLIITVKSLINGPNIKKHVQDKVLFNCWLHFLLHKIKLQ